MLGMLFVTSDREVVLTSLRPQSSGLAQYISAMKRVEKALVDLNTTNLRSNQKAMSDFNSLLSAGTTKLQDMLRSELNQHVSTVEPLHYLTKGMLCLKTGWNFG